MKLLAAEDELADRICEYTLPNSKFHLMSRHYSISTSNQDTMTVKQSPIENIALSQRP